MAPSPLGAAGGRGRRGGSAAIRRAAPALVAAIAAALAVAALTGACFVAAPPPPAEGRRALLVMPAAAWALSGAAAQADIKEPLPPPVSKDIRNYHEKIQEGIDSLFFELKPALVKEDIMTARQYLGSAMMGSHVSPLQTKMLIPMENLLSSNIDSEEDGWVKVVRKISTDVDDIKEYVSITDWKGARASWESARANALTVITDMNARADKAYFVAPDGDYEDKRYNVWLQKRKDDLAERNNKGSLAMR